LLKKKSKEFGSRMALFGGSSFGATTNFGANTGASSNFGTTPNPMKVKQFKI
jgi:hypothetical protein